MDEVCQFDDSRDKKEENSAQEQAPFFQILIYNLSQPRNNEAGTEG